MAGARILWVDDNPGHNRYEQALFEDVGAIFDNVISNDQAHAAIGKVAYDLIVSDIARNGEGSAKSGLAFAKAIPQESPRIPILFYVESVTRSIPEGAFGITNRPEELVHLVLDVLARQRG